MFTSRGEQYHLIHFLRQKKSEHAIVRAAVSVFKLSGFWFSREAEAPVPEHRKGKLF